MRRQIEVAKEKISQIQEAIRELERIGQPAEDPTLELEIRSLRRLSSQIEAEIAEAGLEIYPEVPAVAQRLIGDLQGSLNAIALSSMILAFQKALSLVFSSLSSGVPITRAKSTNAINAASALLPRALALTSLEVQFNLSESEVVNREILERSIEMFSKVVEARDTDSLRAFAEELGAAPIIAIGAWAQTASKRGVGVELKTGPTFEQRCFLVDQEYLGGLASRIYQTSESVTQEIELVGTLDGGRSTTQKFWFILDDGSTISGEVDERFSSEMLLNRRYRATLIVRTIVNPTTARLDEEFVLLRLSEVDD